MDECERDIVCACYTSLTLILLSLSFLPYCTALDFASGLGLGYAPLTVLDMALGLGLGLA